MVSHTFMLFFFCFFVLIGKKLAIFIPKMMDLQCTHPDVHAAFMKGLFPVRRTNGAWAGMFKNLFIESVLMVGLKSTGGLTRGRGFNESTMAQARRMKSIKKRTGNNVGASVSVSSEMRLTMSKKAFLSNESNKQALITLLSQAGISLAHAEGDADYKICKMACVSAVRQPTAEVSCY